MNLAENKIFQETGSADEDVNFSTMDLTPFPFYLAR